MGLGGGILGAIIGSVIGGPWGAAIGGGLGYILGGSSASAQAAQQQQRSTHSLALLFRALGKLAKADGRVSQEEANFVRQLMLSMRLTAAMRSQMKLEFNKGRDSECDFLTIVRDLNTALTGSGTPVQVKYNIINMFCALAAVDRVVTEAEKNMLYEAGRVFNAVQAVENFFASSSRNSSNRSSNGEYSLEESFRTLGVSPDASREEVKKAWRQKAKEFHPDRAQGSGMSEEVINKAKEKIQQINSAYETICRSKGWN